MQNSSSYNRLSSSMHPPRDAKQSNNISNFGQGKNQPNYAIVRLPEGTNVLHFYRLLLENDFTEVSFVNEVRENAFLPSLPVSNGGSNNNGKISIITPTHHPPPIEKQPSQSSTIVANALEGARNLLRQQQTQQPSQKPKQAQQRQFIVQPHLHHRTSIQKATIGAGTPQYSMTQNPHQIVVISSAQSPPVSLTDSPATGGPTAAAIKTSSTTDEYAVCLLCNNRIMSTRLSNLTNHVRRHASMKQYRCCHCQYSHNEMAKVRLHMSHNHQDFDSPPVDQLSFEMQLQWGLLMEQCFPDHAKRFGPSATNSQFRCLDQLQKYVELDRNYPCIECGELVQGYRLVNHLEDAHQQDCSPSACAECGYESSSQWKVRLHISVRHPEKATEIHVEQREPGSNPMLFLHKFFSDVHIPGLEEEEEKLVAELREKNSDYDEHLLDISGQEQEDMNEEETHIHEVNEDHDFGRGNAGAKLGTYVGDLEEDDDHHYAKHVEKVKHGQNGGVDDSQMGEDQQPESSHTASSGNVQKHYLTRKREVSSGMTDESGEELTPTKRQSLRLSHRLMAQQQQQKEQMLTMEKGVSRGNMGLRKK